MDTFLICLAIIIAAFTMALFVWWLFKPKRKTVVIRPSTTRPPLPKWVAENGLDLDVIHKQGAGFGLDLGDRVVKETRRNGEEDLAQQHAAARREQVYQNQQAAARRAAEQNRRDDAAQRQQAAARWAAEQNRRDQEAQMLQARREETWFAENHPRTENQNQPSCDSGSSSSSSSSSSD